jgi:hypothetical protein
MPDGRSYERSLNDALCALADEDALGGTSPHVEARLLAEVRTLARSRRRMHLRLYAIAAVLVVSVAVPVWQLSERPQPPVDVPADLGAGTATEFFPLTFSTVPITGGQLVRLPRVALDSDPRTGVVEYRLTNINRLEPPMDLFVVPPDYTIREMGGRGARAGRAGGRGEATGGRQ